MALSTLRQDNSKKKIERDIKNYLISLEIEKGLSENTIISYQQELEKLKKYLIKGS